MIFWELLTSEKNIVQAFGEGNYYLSRKQEYIFTMNFLLFTKITTLKGFFRPTTIVVGFINYNSSLYPGRVSGPLIGSIGHRK